MELVIQLGRKEGGSAQRRFLHRFNSFFVFSVVNLDIMWKH
jgi:hypothetical protein